MTSEKNPWLTIWAHPRNTMRHILENYPLRLIHTFAILGAFTQVVSGTLAWYSWWVTLIIWVSLSIFMGLLSLYVFGGLLKWTGGWLKGAGSFQDIRASIAWSQLPVFIFFIIKLILLVLVRGNSGSFLFDGSICIGTVVGDHFLMLSGRSAEILFFQSSCQLPAFIAYCRGCHRSNCFSSFLVFWKYGLNHSANFVRPV